MEIEVYNQMIFRYNFHTKKSIESYPQVSDDPFDTISIDTSQVPLCTTFAFIGSKWIVDPTAEVPLRYIILEDDKACN
jgi:hypothetical protein